MAYHVKGTAVHAQSFVLVRVARVQKISQAINTCRFWIWILSVMCLCYFSTATPCNSTIYDLLQSDFLSELCEMVDPKRDLHKAIAFGLGVTREEYDNIYFYKEHDMHRVTEMIFDKVVQKHGNAQFKICHLLRIIKKKRHPDIVQDVFCWHTGNRGSCEVCTRDLFGWWWLRLCLSQVTH